MGVVISSTILACSNVRSSRHPPGSALRRGLFGPFCLSGMFSQACFSTTLRSCFSSLVIPIEEKQLRRVVESVVPEVLVPGRDLAPSVCLVSLPGLSEARVVHPGPLPHELVWVGVGQSVLAGAPAPFSLGGQKRGDNVPRVADEQDHTAFGKGLNKERRTHGAVRFLYDQQAVLAQLGEACVGPFQNERPQGSYPGLSVGVAEDVVPPSPLLLPGTHVVSVAEHVSHVRLVPRSV